MYTAEHMYATVIGDCCGGTERWQFGLRITDGGISAEATALALADDVQNWWLGTGIPAGDSFGSLITYRLTELKVARVGTDGTYPPDENSYSHFYLPPLAGVQTPTFTPVPQSTLCITLLTAKPRGLGSRGRIYLPPCQPMETLAADGRIGAPYALRESKATALLIAAINANALVGNVAVMSRGKAVRGPAKPNGQPTYTYPNPGVTNNVISTRCGRVIDTQRRRRRQLAEDPQASIV